MAALAADPGRRWNGKSSSSGELAQLYGFTDLDGSRPDAWRYIVEVQDAGKPADTTGYQVSGYQELTRAFRRRARDRRRASRQKAPSGLKGARRRPRPARG